MTKPAPTDYLRTYLLPWSLLLLLGLLTACGSSKPRPDWVDKPSTLLSPATHLSGTGVHRYSKAAKEQARAAVIDQLGFDKLPANRWTIHNNAASKLVNSRRQRLMEDTPIMDTWVESGVSQFHVIAGLPRHDAAIALHKLITELDGLTRSEIDRATKERDMLRRITLAGTAVHAQFMRRRFAVAAKEIYPQRPVLREIWQGNRLQKDYVRMLRRIRLYPLVTHDDSNTLSEALRAGLDEAGFGTGSRGNADFQLNAALVIDKRKPAKEGTTITARLSFKLRDNAGLRGSEEWPLQFRVAPGEQEQDAIAAALQEKLGKDLLAAILGFAEKP